MVEVELFSVATYQIKIIFKENGRISCKRSYLSTSGPQPVSKPNVNQEIEELKKKVQDLCERVRKLANAAMDFVDLTNEQSSDATASVHSSDLSPVNGV